jgi:hypothetical protein
MPCHSGPLQAWPLLHAACIKVHVRSAAIASDEPRGSVARRYGGDVDRLIPGGHAFLGFSIVMEIPQARWMVYFMENLSRMDEN